MARPTTTQERVSWTKEEKEKLAKGWFEVFFFALMGSESQNPDQISSKWRDIRLKCTKSRGIYNNLQNICKSGSNDFDAFKATLDQFKKTTQTRKAFSYVKVWPKLKDSPKWIQQMEGTSQTSSGLKRSRNPDATSQQLDGRTHIDINDDLLDLENDQPLRRPVGKNKTKKSGSTSTGSSVIDHFREQFDRYVQVKENTPGIMIQVEQKMIDTQTSFQEAQTTLQTKTDMELVKMKIGRPRRQRFEAFSCDERGSSSLT
uniref:No apical meristem-associated C-terminal domain-containing protein n=1 Tax=Lactuca sativa TaxID=4236 RepID=A0A9R1WXJ6_LACSA|nr:hypothetical protein LSAT_V11C800395440 [Lactuca sativa]